MKSLLVIASLFFIAPLIAAEDLPWYQTALS